MVDIAKENLCINKLISEKTEIIFVEGDIIIPDSKPDVLNTISTSGIACIYKKEIQEGKIRFDGRVKTYIMYVPEGKEDKRERKKVRRNGIQLQKTGGTPAGRRVFLCPERDTGAVERAAVSGDGVKPETTGNPPKKA